MNEKGLTYPIVSLIGSEICQHKMHKKHKKYFDQILANFISLLINNSTICYYTDHKNKSPNSVLNIENKSSS